MNSSVVLIQYYMNGHYRKQGQSIVGAEPYFIWENNLMKCLRHIEHFAFFKDYWIYFDFFVIFLIFSFTQICPCIKDFKSHNFTVIKVRNLKPLFHKQTLHQYEQDVFMKILKYQYKPSLMD